MKELFLVKYHKDKRYNIFLENLRRFPLAFDSRTNLIYDFYLIITSDKTLFKLHFGVFPLFYDSIEYIVDVEKDYIPSEIGRDYYELTHQRERLKNEFSKILEG